MGSDVEVDVDDDVRKLAAVLPSRREGGFFVWGFA